MPSEDVVGEWETAPGAGTRPATLAGGSAGLELGGSPGRELADELALPVELLDRAEGLARGSRAESTWQGYRRDVRLFDRWCARHGRRSRPASPETVRAWLADLSHSGWRDAGPDDPPGRVVAGQVFDTALGPATIARRLAAVSVAHRVAQLDNPTTDEHVRATMAGIRRQPGNPPPRRRAAARTPQVEAATAGLDPVGSSTDARDLALILLGYSAALRRSDLAGLDIDDLTLEADGLALRLRRSKTDQDQRGAVVGVAAEDDGSCPAAEAWTLWRDHLARAGVTRGPAFRPIHRSHAGTETIRPVRLSGAAINNMVKRRAAQAGLEGEWGSHSLRRGLATQAIANGKTETEVMRHGRWRSLATMRSYVDEAERFGAGNPSRGLGLSSPTAASPAGAGPDPDRPPTEIGLESPRKHR